MPLCVCRLFQSLETQGRDAAKDSSPSASDGYLPASVERASCAVLLGEPESALQLLGIQPTTSRSGIRRVPDPEVTAFVRVGRQSGGISVHRQSPVMFGLFSISSPASPQLLPPAHRRTPPLAQVTTSSVS